MQYEFIDSITLILWLNLSLQNQKMSKLQMKCCKQRDNIYFEKKVGLI